jgi:hypothetical protein
VIDELMAMRKRLLLATGLGLSGGVGSACLESAPLDECFERAERKYKDRFEVVQVYVSPGEECPDENSDEVREEAKLAGTCWVDGFTVALNHVACGPRIAEPYCEYVAVYAGKLKCEILGGRPFLVDGELRSAGAQRREDWAAGIAIEVRVPEDPELRRVLARHWTTMALAEHASIAAFARFAIQLMQLGAPAGLVRGCQAAMADETRHARLAFALASRFAQAPVGPRALDVRGAVTGGLEVGAILRDVVVEGCLGETRAAMELRVAAAHCTEPALAAALLGIADDEERHAALAWRFVDWLLSRRPELASSFERALEHALTRRMPDPEPSGLDWGMLDRERLRALDAGVLIEIVAPLGRAVLTNGLHAWGAEPCSEH